jgi:hypothetical protein
MLSKSFTGSSAALTDGSDAIKEALKGRPVSHIASSSWDRRDLAPLTTGPDGADDYNLPRR